MMDSSSAERRVPTRVRANSNQLSMIVKDLRLAKTVRMDLNAGLVDMALDALKNRRALEDNVLEKRKGWFSDAIDALCKNDVPKAIIIVSDVAWLRQTELDMLTNKGNE